jgi:hypothetical protein
MCTAFCLKCAILILWQICSKLSNCTSRSFVVLCVLSKIEPHKSTGTKPVHLLSSTYVVVLNPSVSLEWMERWTISWYLEPVEVSCWCWTPKQLRCRELYVNFEKVVAWFEKSCAIHQILFTHKHYSRSVIPNRVAAAHYGAAKRCQGCRQIWNDWLLIDVLLHKVPPNYHF